MGIELWPAVSAALGTMFILFAFVFTVKKGDATEYINGFNTLSEKEKSKYDRDAISRDWRNKLLLYAAVCLIGAALGKFVFYLFSVAALLIWVVLILRESKFDYREKFKKYKY